MQTIERPTEAGGTPPSRRRAFRAGAGVVVALLALPLLLLLVMSKWGVLIAVLLGFVVGMWIFVVRRGYLFLEVVAFLIHFDGLGAGPIRMGRLVAAAAFAVLAYKLVVEKWRPPAIPTRHWVPILLITIWAVATGAWSNKASAWFFSMGLLGLALAYFGVSGMLTDSHEKIRKFLRAFWWGGLWGSAAGVLALFLGTRSVGFGGDPNYFGLLQASLIPLTVYYRRHARNRQEKILYTFALLFVLAGAAGAGSRSGLIGGAIAIVGTMVTRPGLSRGGRAKVAVGAVALAGVAFAIGFVANPANLQRGFSDRGAGRLDFWNVATDLIAERPLQGQGFGQLMYEIPPNLPNTPGVEVIQDDRENVSSHNTWLDVLGDLGIVGLVLWVSIFAVTFWGFLRPRWPQTREISVTLTVMMLPVMSSSMFQPLLNNKLAWSLIGLSAALQVPSWQARWRGYRAAGSSELVPVGAMDTSPAAVVGPAASGAAASWADDARAAGGSPPADGWSAHDDPALARWDIRVSQRFRVALLVGPLIGMVVGAAIASAIPTRYTATAGVIVPGLETNAGSDRIAVPMNEVQGVHTLAISGAYAAELQRLSSLDLTVPEIRERVSVLRPTFANYMEISYTDTDRARAEAALPYVVRALDDVVVSDRDAGLAGTADELRPVNPGESRFYTGPLYLRVSQDAVLETQQPRRVWMIFIGAIVGFLVAVAFVLFQQRKPRVNNDDDFRVHLGLPVWTHVGRAGRRYAGTFDQYAQVMTMVEDSGPLDAVSNRVVIATPRPDRGARGLAMGVAAALAAEGRRVVLVDAQLDHPLLSRRLGARRSRGLAEVAAGEATMGSVVRRVGRWRLPTSVRRTLGDGGDLFRFVPAGRSGRGATPVVHPQFLDTFDDDVTLVVLAPSLLGTVPGGPVLAWADAVALALVEGRTVTFDAEDAALRVRTFTAAPSGVVLLDV
ncbi:MAG: O-antigen ligase family protein [Microthrixaceae bacterium]